ncbi:MAG: hypothetical protein AB8I08_34385 [Sandaracinaceae bacterium]
MSADRVRPPVLWIAGTFVVLLGLLGACGGAFGIGNVLLQGPMMDAQRDLLEGSGQSDAEVRRQLELQSQTLEITERWQLPMIGGQVLNVLSSLLLLVAGVLLFRWSPLTFKVLVAACIGAAIADLLLGGIGMLVQRETMALMSETMVTGDAEVDRLTSGFARAGATSGICFGIGWVLAKLGVYAGALWAVGRSSHRTLFEASDDAAS